MADVYINRGSTIVVCITAVLWNIHLVGICAFWCWFMAIPQMHRVAVPSLLQTVRGCLMLLKQLSSSHSVWCVYSFGGLAVMQLLCLPYMVGRSFQVWYHPVTLSTWNLWWALNLVNGYQDDE